MNIAIIPARGGSKRIPRKNIKLFHGKPMIAYSIEAAKKSGCFDRILVSTDDEEIAKVAKKWGAEVPFMRPEHIADDFSTTMDVMKHAVDWCVEAKWQVDKVCCIYATAPFLSSAALQEGLSKLTDPNVHYAFSATTFAFPIQRALLVNKSGHVEMIQPEHKNTRSQDLPEAIHDAGQFYWGQMSAYLQQKAFFGESSKAVILPRKNVQDIDTQEDWELAEALFSAMKLESC
ncbi:pseudaminic acid cytidylyltransferase [Marinomonas sp. GJ51-6]|uniref:pseudaminic acid cytidylyltransferase n=1 Tax=Marinomonas sp. GJ51-6 TaxID=2992802 RepID=UPI002934E78A|nr:pseudaminic acid cytidylyltransferase [Marinomonas sp. GJ51-6]WOD08369.1 pseudaminic acid cytidylyltransferase [Marinomonas sp. GJ51-6]